MPDEKVKFGISQIGQQTPKWAKNIFTGVLYGCAIGTLAVATFTHIPEHIKYEIAITCAQVTAFVHALSVMLGVKVDGPPDQSQNSGKPQ